MSLKITERAIKEVKRLSEEMGVGHTTIRVGCKGGSCAGFAYDLQFDEIIRDTDEILEIDGVKIICDEVSFGYIDGTIIDWSDGLMSAGFSFRNNPQSNGSCGCGKSFSV